MIAHTQPRYQPRKLSLSIDSLCDIREVKHPRALQKEGYPDSIPEKVAANITKYISNYAQSFAVECGYNYVPNFKSKTPKATDLVLKLSLREIISPMAWQTGDSLGYFKLRMQLYYPTTQQTYLISDVLMGQEGGSCKNYQELLKEELRYFPYFFFTMMTDLSIQKKPVSSYGRQYTFGIQEVFKAVDTLTPPELPLALTKVCEQIILHKRKVLFDKASPYEYISNYSRTKDKQIPLSFEIRGSIRMSPQQTAYLTIEWIDTNQQVLKYETIELMPLLLEDGNYIELLLSRSLLSYEFPIVNDK